MFFKTGFLKYCAQPPSPTYLLSLVFSFSRGCMARAGLSNWHVWSGIMVSLTGHSSPRGRTTRTR